MKLWICSVEDQVKDFKTLEVWKKAHALVLGIYRATEGFPAKEEFGLTSQMRRAAVSVVSNIAEGCGRYVRGGKELDRFLTIAEGSLSELECQLLVARDLGFLSNDHHLSLENDVRRVGRMLQAFKKALNPSGARAKRGDHPERSEETPRAKRGAES